MINIIRKWLASISANKSKPVKYHEWALIDGFLHEPGISDTHDGRWARKLITCINCHETRKVWVGLQLNSPMLVTMCPQPEIEWVPV